MNAFQLLSSGMCINSYSTVVGLCKDSRHRNDTLFRVSIYNNIVEHKPEFCLGNFSWVPYLIIASEISSRDPKIGFDNIDFYLGNFSKVPPFCLGNLD